MSKRIKAISICNRALHELESELAKTQGMVADSGQLLRFKEYVKKIIRQLESGQLPARNKREFGMGRAIVDSWPLDSKLGNLLFSAEQAYRDV